MPPETQKLQDRIQTQKFWTDLMLNEQSDELLNLTSSQIADTTFLQPEQQAVLNARRTRRLIQNDSVMRYPVRVPKTALKTFSDKYEEKMTESKRRRKQNLYGTDLYRKKLNAQDVESAESGHQNEKNSQLDKFMNTIQTSNPELLQGKSVNDIMSEQDIKDRAEFLLYDEKSIDKNIDIMFGRLEIPEERSLFMQECVRQFRELDLSADMRTDKALAKDAERLEKVNGKARAMINLVDRHPEIMESMEGKEKEEFKAKLDRAYAFINYYQVRKDIITDDWYRDHENSEISMRFEPMPQNLATQLKDRRDALAQAQQAQGQDTGAGQAEQLAQAQQQLAQTEQLVQQYYRQQNLTRKIWDAEQSAVMMDRYVPGYRQNINLYDHNIYETNQTDVAEEVAVWESRLNENYDPIKLYTGNSAEIPIDNTKTFGEFFANHYKEDDKYYKAVTTCGQIIAGTEDKVLDMNRNYSLFANWNGLRFLSKTEFTDMMDNLVAFTIPVTGNMTAKDIADLRERQLAALRTFKEILVRETPYLQEKYGISLRLMEPYAVSDLENELFLDVGNLQTISDTMKYFKKYGMFDESSPQDKEMEQTMEYITNALISSKTTMGILNGQKGVKKQTYADTMRIYDLIYQQTITSEWAADSLGIRDLERKLQKNLNVQIASGGGSV